MTGTSFDMPTAAQVKEAASQEVIPVEQRREISVVSPKGIFTYKAKEYASVRILSQTESGSFYCEAIDDETALFISAEYARHLDGSPAAVGDDIWVYLQEATKVVGDKQRYKVRGIVNYACDDTTVQEEMKCFFAARKPGDVFKGTVCAVGQECCTLQVSPSLKGTVEVDNRPEGFDLSAVKVGDLLECYVKTVDLQENSVTFSLCSEQKTENDPQDPVQSEVENEQFAYQKGEYAYAKILSQTDGDSYYCECIDGISAFFVPKSYAKHIDGTEAKLGEYIWAKLDDLTKVIDNKRRYKAFGLVGIRFEKSDDDSECKLFAKLHKVGDMFKAPVTGIAEDCITVQVSPRLTGRVLTKDASAVAVGDVLECYVTSIDRKRCAVEFTLSKEEAKALFEQPLAEPEKQVFTYKTKEYACAKIVSMTEYESFYCECIDDYSVFFIPRDYAKGLDGSAVTIGDYIWAELLKPTEVVCERQRYKAYCKEESDEEGKTAKRFKNFAKMRKVGEAVKAQIKEVFADHWTVQLAPNLVANCSKQTAPKQLEPHTICAGDVCKFCITDMNAEDCTIELTMVADEVKVEKVSLWSLLPESMRDVIITPKIIELLSNDEIAAIADALDNNLTKWALAELLDPIYQQARANRQITIKRKATTVYIDFATEYKTSRGAPISVGIKRNMNENVWIMNLIGFTNVESVFERMVYAPDIQSALDSLAELALDGEEWDYGGEFETGKKYILRQYIRFNFYKSQLDGKIVINERTGDAVFNTGLVDSTYDDIYCYLKRNTKPNDEHYQRWELCYFACWGKGANGKDLNKRFSTRPDAPQYIDPNHAQDVFYDFTKDLYCDYDHIIEDNLGRIPLAFIRKRLAYSEDVKELLDEYERMPTRRNFEQLKDLIIENDGHLRNLMEGLRTAVEVAKKQCKWNYKTAVPIYYPRNNALSLLLPLCLSDDNSKADVALVVERLDNGNYQGQTILTLQMAFLDARQICRPNSEWLKASKAEADVDEEKLEDLEDLDD